MLSLPVLLAGLFAPGGRLWRLGLAATLLAGAGGLALTLSRGAWIGTACVAVALTALAVRERLLSRRQVVRMVLALAAAAAVFGAAFGQRTWERLTASDEGNLNVRFELNEVALRIIADRPLTGIGLNNIVREMDAYDPMNVKSRLPGPTHNVYLLEAAEGGVPAAVFFVALFATIVFIGYRAIDAIPDLAARWLAAALLAGLVGFLVTQLADFSHRLEPLRSLVWLNVGLLFALRREYVGRRRSEEGAADLA
jgi:O-antigen ligase